MLTLTTTIPLQLLTMGFVFLADVLFLLHVTTILMRTRMMVHVNSLHVQVVQRLMHVTSTQLLFTILLPLASYPDTGYDCDGVCLLDTDGDGICDMFEIPGCDDSEALNYDPSATDDNGTCTYPVPGCHGRKRL